MGLNKRKWDENAIAPLIIAMLLLAGITTSAVIGAVYFAQPDITYNISDTGFSIAGFEIDSLTVVIVIIVIVGLVLLYVGRKTDKPKTP